MKGFGFSWRDRRLQLLIRICVSHSVLLYSWSTVPCVYAWGSGTWFGAFATLRPTPSWAARMLNCHWMSFHGMVPVALMLPLSEKSRSLQWICKLSDIYKQELLFSSARESRSWIRRRRCLAGTCFTLFLHCTCFCQPLRFEVGVMCSQYGWDTLKRLLCKSLSESPTISQNTKINNWFL